MRILFLGDIVGETGRGMLKTWMPDILARETPDFVIANGENAAGGKGITGQIAAELFDLGIHVITLGNHTFDRKEVENIISHPRVLRPVNYPPQVPGRGYGIYECAKGIQVAVVSLMGRVYLPLIDCPFRCMNEVLEKISREAKVIFVDFHAEVTSEKQAMGWYLDGRVSAMVGTHTHIPTADERIMPGGMAYLTDAGMVGPADGCIGMDREIVIKKFLTGIPQHFVIAKGNGILQGCVIDIEESTGKATAIRRIQIPEMRTGVIK